MRRNIVFGLFCAMMPLLSCNRAPISKDRLVEVIIEMHTTDMKIEEQSQWRSIADTTLVYAAILHEHGYSVKDFNRSLDYYLLRPDKLMKTFIVHRDRLVTKKNELQEVLIKIYRKVDTTEFLRRFDSTRISRWPFGTTTNRDSIVTPLHDSTSFHKSLPVYDFCPFSPHCIWSDPQQAPWNISWCQFITDQRQMVQF